MYMTNPEVSRENVREFLEKQARETVAAFDLETFFREGGNFNAHMDTIATYLDVMVVPELVRKCENSCGYSPLDASAFYEQFREGMIAELESMKSGLSTKKQQKQLDKFIKEIRDFEFIIPV